MSFVNFSERLTKNDLEEGMRVMMPDEKARGTITEIRPKIDECLVLWDNANGPLPEGTRNIRFIREKAELESVA